MANKSFMESIFSNKEEDELSDEEKKKKKEEELEKNNPFIHKKSLDPKNGEKALRLLLDNMGDSVEKHYFFFQKFMTGHPSTSFGIKTKHLYKLKDVFDASVSSSFHGQIGTKTSAMQQQVSSYLSQIGQLTKTIFPLVREIRMMDERMEFYRESLNKPQGDDSARQNEVALKSTWVEVVEQGMQNPNSVYSMATKLGFVTLPDLFFGINPHGKTPKEQKERLSKILDAMQKEKSFNFKVRTALEKKMIAYYTWKQKTWQEMHHTWKFRLKSLKQHYNVIHLYTSWIKPYLTALKSLQMKGDTGAHELVSSFESSKMELELLAVFKEGKEGKEEKKNYNSCALVRITVVTRPELIFAQGGQRQVQHSGQVKISIEPYVATTEDIEFYRNYTDKEIMKRISGVEYGDVVQDIESVLESIGDDVKEYLREAEEGKKEEKKEEKKNPKQSIMDPFTALMDSLKMFKLQKSDKKNKTDEKARENEKKSLAKDASGKAWALYDIFKKSNGMLTT